MMASINQGKKNITDCQTLASGLITTRRLYLPQIVNKYVTGKCVEEQPRLG